ncbi:hypothetical protein B0A55_08999 [Friedmanniomyces simplex]|uniref:ATP-dependent RNA helicase n=1 Tax=Friedmanniomyces simplex TaxID=329884 RepID=A0A4U0X1D3_9PEZI|nr:hypothetical protein B0A55_08999 [Friedmanniomyces simplex]
MATAPLYKRYIPPKPADVSAVKATAAPVKKKTVPSPPPVEKKRKRERPEEDVAERKAKKLRKRGVEATAETVLRDQRKEREDVRDEPTEPQNGLVSNDVQEGEDGGKGGKMSMKKRHKLEKEARKVRKEAEKVGKLDGSDDVKAPAEGDVEVLLEGQHGRTTIGMPQGDVVETADPADALHEIVKPNKRREQREDAAGDGERTEENVPATEQGNVPSKAERKTKGKGKMQEQDLPPPQDHAAKSEETTELPQQPAETDSTPQPKKRRHKLEAVLKQAETGAENEKVESIEHLGKHDAVLGKYQKAAKRSQKLASQADEQIADAKEDSVVLRDLAPIPQADKAPTPEFNPNYSALPPWLANPIAISSDSKATFSSLGLAKETVHHMSQLGFSDALPVQQALIPLLLPPGIPGARYFSGAEAVLPDLAISAATGSGKTIAYLLPVLEGLKQGRPLGKLSALVVVPTRELVMQVAAVAESLANGSDIKVGTATGTGKLREEQVQLIKRSQKYDPSGHAALMAKAHQRNYPPDEEVDEEAFEAYLIELESEDAREEQRISDAVSGLADHAPTYTSSVDVLVCTPGRLLEHVASTLGFDLTRLDYLVLDEADKLLDQRYDGFRETLDNERERDSRKPSPRVRKIVLSATMTSDVGKIAGLRLFRPKMVVVRGNEGDTQTSEKLVAGVAEGVRHVGDAFELPPTLVEYCVPVGDGAEKPLFLVALLESRILPAGAGEATAAKSGQRRSVDEHSELDADSESDVDSTSSSEVSSSSEDSESADSEDEDIEGATASPDTGEAETPNMHPARAALITPTPSSMQPRNLTPTILIFTSSTESATRLSHLLTRLKPAWAPWINTLTKAKPSRRPRPTSAGKELKPSITISTDRSARGLDTLTVSHRDITHVIQYDVPRSVEGYVHRVGRTARAGKEGEAWTLYTFTEARWFLHKVCGVEGREGEGGKQCKVRRRTGVEKAKVVVEDEGLRSRFAEVLEGMRGEVFGGGAGRHR